MAGGACLTLLPKFDARAGARGDPARPGDDLPGRADHVHGPAGGEGARALRRQHRQGGRLGRRVAARRGAARRASGPSASRSSRATACPRPPPSPPSTTRTGPAKPGSVGTPIRGVEFALETSRGTSCRTRPAGEGRIGEIVIRGENIMKGYWQRPEETAEAMRGGWFHSGDLATRDADGYYFIVDRKKDMIIRNGFNVYPREVEEVLYTHPAVAEAAVFGVPDADARRGGRAPWSPSRTAPTPAPRSCATSSPGRSRPTSTRAWSASAPCRRARPARS